MLKRRNRIYRRIAVALTVALLAGQSHAFVLAEEDAGGAPQTEITGEADTSTPDNGNVADGGNADNGNGGNTGGTEQSGGNGGTDNQNPEDNENEGDRQGDGDRQDQCICGTKCAADAVNTDCPVCAADYEACTGKADDAGNNGSGNDDTENSVPENGGQDNINSQNAGEGVNLSVNAALSEMTLASMSDEEAGIDAQADEGVEAYAEEDTFYYPENPAEGEKRLKYRRIPDKIGEVEVAEQGEDAVSGKVTIPLAVEDSDGNKYTVTSIGDKAFSLCRSLSSVEIPDGVTSIEWAAFAGCAKLSSVEIPNTVTKIGVRAFSACTSLSGVEIPNSVTEIGSAAFSACKSLSSVEIPNSVTEIWFEAFSVCKSLTSVEIPNSITSIERGTFKKCSSLTSITIPDSVTSIEWEGFNECSSLTNVEIPDSVTSIEGCAFWKCSSLTKVVIPDGVTSIEAQTFMECGKLTEVTIPDSVTSIGDWAFDLCRNLKSIKIPDGVTKIGELAFCGCDSLTDVEIPNGVTSIEKWTFSECGALKEITIPDRVKSIGERAFYNCKNLNTLQIAISSNQEYHFPTVEKDAFTGLPDSTDRNDIVIIKGADLSDDDLKVANVARAFNDAKGKDGLDDDLWYGWRYNGAPVIKDTHKVTITVQKDDTPWTDHKRTFALTKDGGTIFVTDLNAVEAGEYEIYDVTDSGNKLKTGVTVPVANTDASATVDYYTVAFCYLDDDDNEQTYGDSTDWKPQTILKKVGRVAEPATNPTKENYSFKWVTTKDGDEPFDFGKTEITAPGTKIYARWTENTVTTYHTVTFYDGTTPYGDDTPQRSQRVADGQKAIRPENPKESKDPAKAGWQFAEWVTEDNGSNLYDFNNPVNVDTNLYARWLEKTGEEFIIRASATDGGIIDPKGDIHVAQGGEQTFTITPKEGYRIRTVTVDGDQDVTAGLKDTRARAQAGARYYTFTNVTKDYTIHAEFERDGSSSGGDNPNPGGGGDNPNPGGGGDNPNPGGGGDNPDPGGDNPGGGGDNPNPGGDNPGSGSGGGGGGNSGGDHSNNGGGGNNGGGSTNPDGGNGTGNAIIADNGNGAGNGQTVAGTAVSSAQAGSGAAAASAGNHTASDSGKAVGASGGAANGSASSASGQTAGAGGTTANGREPKTGDASYLEVYATLAMIAGLTYLLLYVMEESRGMSEQEKEAFVAAFIRWGKKGGAFRKCCAMAAIFCLLAYYHAVGKRVGENALRKKYFGPVPD